MREVMSFQEDDELADDREEMLVGGSNGGCRMSRVWMRLLRPL